MNGVLPKRIIFGLVLFSLCQVMILFARLMPVSGSGIDLPSPAESVGLCPSFICTAAAEGSINLPGPDLGLCLLFAWLLRRPDQIPAIAVALVFLLEDVLLLRPLGLWSGIVLIASEALRLREPRWRDQPFMLEWLRVGLLIGVMVLTNHIVQMLFLLPVPNFGMVMMQYGFTIVSYPLVVFAARWLVGLRRISPAQQELGRY